MENRQKSGLELEFEKEIHHKIVQSIILNGSQNTYYYQTLKLMPILMFLSFLRYLFMQDYIAFQNLRQK